MVSNATPSPSPSEGWDDWNSRCWESAAAGDVVHVLADGTDGTAVFQQVVTICASLHLRCLRWPSLPPNAPPSSGALIISRGPAESTPDPTGAPRGWAVGLAHGNGVPLIFLTHREHQSDAEDAVTRWAYHRDLGRIVYRDPRDFTYALTTTLGELFGRHRLVSIGHRRGWPRNVFEGLKARQLARILADMQIHAPISIVGEAMWMQKQRELEAEGQAAVTHAKEVARHVLAPGYPIPIPIFEIAARYGLVHVQHRPAKTVSGAVTGSGGVGGVQINPAEDVRRQRFTWAHELGHHVLGHADNAIAARPHYVSADEVYDPLELAADAFAREVLMPENEVLRRASAGYTCGRMARDFWVGFADMQRRLQDLGL